MLLLNICHLFYQVLTSSFLGRNYHSLWEVAATVPFLQPLDPPLSPFNLFLEWRSDEAISIFDPWACLCLIFPLDFLQRYGITVLLFITVFFRSFWLTWLFHYLSHLGNFTIYPCWSLIYYQASSSTFLPCSPSQEMSPDPSTEPVLRRPNRS